MSDTVERDSKSAAVDFYGGLPSPELVRLQEREPGSPSFTVAIDGTTVSCDGRKVGLKPNEVFCLGVLMVAGSEGIDAAGARAKGFRESNRESEVDLIAAMRGVNYALTATCNTAERGVIIDTGEDGFVYSLNPNITFVTAAEAEAAKATKTAKATKDVGVAASGAVIPAQTGGGGRAKATSAPAADQAKPPAAKAAKATKATKAAPQPESTDEDPGRRPRPEEATVITGVRIERDLGAISAQADPNILRNANLRSPEQIAVVLSELCPWVITADIVIEIAGEDPMIKPHQGQYSEYAYRRIEAALRERLSF